MNVCSVKKLNVVPSIAGVVGGALDRYFDPCSSRPLHIQAKFANDQFDLALARGLLFQT